MAHDDTNRRAGRADYVFNQLGLEVAAAKNGVPHATVRNWKRQGKELGDDWDKARAAQMIGHLKAATSLPVYEPNREKVIYSNVRAANKGPLPDIELTHIYERIIDVMRALQRNELASERNAQAGGQGHTTGAESPETGNKQ